MPPQETLPRAEQQEQLSQAEVRPEDLQKIEKEMNRSREFAEMGARAQEHDCQLADVLLSVTLESEVIDAEITPEEVRGRLQAELESVSIGELLEAEQGMTLDDWKEIGIETVPFAKLLAGREYGLTDAATDVITLLPGLQLLRAARSIIVLARLARKSKNLSKEEAAANAAANPLLEISPAELEKAKPQGVALDKWLSFYNFAKEINEDFVGTRDSQLKAESTAKLKNVYLTYEALIQEGVLKENAVDFLAASDFSQPPIYRTVAEDEFLVHHERGFDPKDGRPERGNYYALKALQGEEMCHELALAPSERSVVMYKAPPDIKVIFTRVGARNGKGGGAWQGYVSHPEKLVEFSHSKELQDPKSFIKTKP